MSYCPDCAARDAEITALRARIARLENTLSRARAVIEHQKRQLDTARTTCQWYIQKSDEARRQHLPRGTWSLWKGRDETARAVFQLIGQDFGIGMLVEIISLLGG
jgi:hypothetical protein